MSKELPYFRFYPSEWLEGDITLEKEETQGFFITLLAWYWKKDCLVNLDFINKRLIKGKAKLKQCLNNLIESKIIKVDKDSNVDVYFLNEQYDALSELRQKRVDAGRKGGSSKAQAMLKQSSSYKDKDKDKDKEINISFNEFWDLYDKKVGDKTKIEAKWNKLPNNARELIFIHVPKYKRSQPEKRYRKDPSTYLNNKSWNDEIIDDKPKPGISQIPH